MEDSQIIVSWVINSFLLLKRRKLLRRALRSFKKFIFISLLALRLLLVYNLLLLSIKPSGSVKLKKLNSTPKVSWRLGLDIFDLKLVDSNVKRSLLVYYIIQYFLYLFVCRRINSEGLYETFIYEIIHYFSREQFVEELLGHLIRVTECENEERAFMRNVIFDCRFDYWVEICD